MSCLEYVEITTILSDLYTVYIYNYLNINAVVGAEGFTLGVGLLIN